MFDPHRSERGAVSIYLIMIFAAVFAFVSIFIDFARMSALQAKTEMLAHAASRSVMSAYDPQLVEQYGLFAFGETDEGYIMSKVLQDQLEIVQRSDDLPVLGIRLDSSTAELQRPLGTYAVFEQQIREQMKYKAPIDFTIEVINKFKPMSQIMKEASNTVDLLGKLQKLYDRREAKLDELLEKQRKAAQAAAEMTPFIPRSGGSGVPGSSIDDGISTATDVAAQYDDYAWKVEEDRNREPLERIYTWEISRYQNGASRLFGKLGEENRDADKQHKELLPQARELLMEAKEINEQMRIVIEEAEQRPAQDGYNEVSAMASTGGGEPATGGDEIAKIRQRSRDLLLPEQLFSDFEADIAEQEAGFGNFHSSANAFLSMESSVISASTSSGSLESAVSGMKGNADKYMHDYVDSGAGNILEQSRKRLEAHRGSDEERKRTEREAGGKLKEAKDLIGRISDLKGELEEQQEQFDRLESFYKSNREMNKQSMNGEEAGSTLGESPYDAGGEAMAGMDSLYGGLSGLMKGMSDNCFQTEYIVSYFNYLDVSTLDELMEESENGGRDKIDILADAFAADKQEVEYILYGFHNPAGNIAAAYGEIFTMRLAIRTMEGFIKNGAKGNTLLVLAAALLYGVEHAVKDMIELTKKGSIPLSDYLKVKLTYRDHLRIFLLLHGRNERRLSRMLAVVRMNTGIVTEERATYLKSTVTTTIPLWFLPGVAKTMGEAGALTGRVEGNQYYAIKQADFSY